MIGTRAAKYSYIFARDTIVLSTLDFGGRQERGSRVLHEAQRFRVRFGSRQRNQIGSPGSSKHRRQPLGDLANECDPDSTNQAGSALAKSCKATEKEEWRAVQPIFPTKAVLQPLIGAPTP